MSAANLRMNNKRNQYRNQYHLICRVISICLCALFCLSFGCTSKKEERLQEIDFTVVDDDEIPEELKTIIDQKKTGEFKLTYADQDELYIVVGYGKQLTGGYSIQFPDVYLTKENIVVTSVLLGPEGEEPANISYPYAVIKIEYRPEPVLLNYKNGAYDLYRFEKFTEALLFCFIVFHQIRQVIFDLNEFRNINKEVTDTHS